MISRTGEEKGSWLLVNSIETESIKHVQQTIGMLARQKRLTKLYIKALQEAVDMPQIRKGAWLLLAEMGPYVASLIDDEPVLERWNEIKDNTSGTHIY